MFQNMSDVNYSVMQNNKKCLFINPTLQIGFTLQMKYLPSLLHGFPHINTKVL